MSPVKEANLELKARMAGYKKKSDHKKLSLHGKFESEYKELLVEIGNRIRKRREQLGLTQEDMDSEPLPIDERNFRRIEAGTRNVTIKTLFAIAKKLKIKPHDILKADKAEI